MSGQHWQDELPHVFTLTERHMVKSGPSTGGIRTYISPSGKFTVTLMEIDPELLAWCRENLTDKWAHSVVDFNVIGFGKFSATLVIKDPHDAFAFKMRWG